MELFQKEHIIHTFNSIAERYSMVNHIISFGQDIHWRKVFCRKAYRFLKNRDTVVDVATGNGECFRYCLGDFRRKIGIDPAVKMLELGKESFPDVAFLQAVAEEIPLKGEVADLITVAFGVRNFHDRKKAFSEFYRILKKEGIVAVLEFYPIENGSLINKAVATYIYKIMPYLGGAFTGNLKGYRYLAHSIKRFITPDLLAVEMEKEGLKLMEKTYLFPNVVILTAKKV
ncbi:MAG: ubiquinone/menaquinone biosynthesis methyltransferase [Aquificae bacterium]|nr:ubiquinone/menaquinone biosynthesis methyltransferase [Aquificota bacterium]